MATQNYSTLTPDRAAQVIYELLSCEETRDARVLLIGDPGVGKSQLLRQVARRMRATLYDLRLLQLDLGSMRGLERIISYADGRVETVPARPYFLPEYVADEDITDETPRYIIFLDEIMAADDAIRKCAFELLTDNRVGPHKIGKNVWVVAAGNSAEDGSIVHEMDRPTRRRFLPIMVETSVDALVKHAIREGWHHIAVAFIRNHPDMISASEEDIQNDNFSMPNPAAIEKISNGLKALDAKRISREAFEVLAHGNLGNFAATQLLEEIDDENACFDLKALLDARPEERVYPSSSFGTYSLIGALAAYGDTPEKLDKSLSVVLGIPDAINDVVEECKAAFFYTIVDKMAKWNLYTRWAHDDRVTGFLERTEEITAEADRAYAQQQEQEPQMQEAA